MIGRSVPAEFDPSAVAEIDRRLAAIAADGVAVPLAVESGSRAWGFPSPDSDYDCRFLFVRRRADALSLWPPRDVIETPLTPVIDVNGWDLSKALRLLVDKGNAVLLEWLMSPIRYRDDPGFRTALRGFAEAHADRRRVAWHYLHLARRQQALHVRADGDISCKKLFYVLRPALALRWLRLHPDARFPPMRFQTLVADGDLAPGLAGSIDALIAAKASSREAGTMLYPAELRALVDGELAAAGTGMRLAPPAAATRAAADRLFADMIDRFGPT